MNKARTTKKMNVSIVNIDNLKKVHHPLPSSWTEAAGLLKGKKKKINAHVREVRKEWNTPENNL